MTLFGRDSLWAARFALPSTCDSPPARCARSPGARRATHDVATAAEPGKILHEVRTGPADRRPRAAAGLLRDGRRHAALDQPAPRRVVLGPRRRRGRRAARPAGGGDGLVDVARAVPVLPRRERPRVEQPGLEGLRRLDPGRRRRHRRSRPITLCEVQGYAYRAALDAARLLDAFDRPGADAARGVRRRLAAGFREHFWVDGPAGPFPAVALDGSGRPVDSLTSNIGHLPATGMLDDAEVAAVAAQIARPCLDSGYGLRTLADDHPRYNPLGYHTGTVWPHDTAIAIDGLARTGHGDVAGRLAAGLLAAAAPFDYRLPELFGGWPASAGPPLAYPASCRPQAWAAAARSSCCAPPSGCTPTFRRARSRSALTQASPPSSRSTVTGLRVGRARPRHPRRRRRLPHRRHDRTADARDLTPTVRPCSAGTCGCSPPPPTSHAAWRAPGT